MDLVEPFFSIVLRIIGIFHQIGSPGFEYIEFRHISRPLIIDQFVHRAPVHLSQFDAEDGFVHGIGVLIGELNGYRCLIVVLNGNDRIAQAQRIRIE